ncbi:MAG TPA: HAD family phosphatase [Cellvibrionaceae bacterium]|nr:HAD family phosphatase [Cellvibrionaceae bacterium]
MLVIFDCDGVLVESEALAAQAFSQVLARYEIVLSADECERLFIGKTLTQCIETLQQSYPGRLPGDFREQLDEASEALFAQQLAPVQGVEAVLTAVRARGIALAVASNGGLAKIQLNLTRTGLIDYFAANIVSAEHVPQPKPAPDVYLAAAEAQGVPAQFCCVVEDSNVGALAGLSAGMRVLLFRPPWRTHHSPAPAGGEGFEDMQQLLGLILRY